MGVVKFEKRRRRDRTHKVRRLDPVRVLAIAGVVVALLSATIWLIRDARDLGETFRPAEGSLIVNINTASTEELISVPGLGPARAAQIVAGRPYESIDELAKIAGIGNDSLDSLRPFVTVDGETRKID